MPIEHNTWDELFHTLHLVEGAFKDLVNSNVEPFNMTALGHLGNLKEH
jgi:hypothetical protein